jgi:hypothetical protein
MKRTASQKGKHSRRKGATYEREIANALKHLYPNARRGIGQSRNAGEVPDVDGTPWWIEAKHHKHVNIRKAYAQAVEASAPGRRNVLVISRDTGIAPDLVTMSFVQFVALMQTLERLHKAVDAELDR